MENTNKSVEAFAITGNWVDQSKQLKEKYAHAEIPRPPYWGGYLVKPVSIEFWQGRPNRLHDRLLYTLGEDGKWGMERLAP